LARHGPVPRRFGASVSITANAGWSQNGTGLAIKAMFRFAADLHGQFACRVR